MAALAESASPWSTTRTKARAPTTASGATLCRFCPVALAQRCGRDTASGKRTAQAGKAVPAALSPRETCGTSPRPHHNAKPPGAGPARRQARGPRSQVPGGRRQGSAAELAGGFPVQRLKTRSKVLVLNAGCSTASPRTGCSTWCPAASACTGRELSSACHEVSDPVNHQSHLIAA